MDISLKNRIAMHYVEFLLQRINFFPFEGFLNQFKELKLLSIIQFVKLYYTTRYFI